MVSWIFSDIPDAKSQEARLMGIASAISLTTTSAASMAACKAVLASIWLSLMISFKLLPSILRHLLQEERDLWQALGSLKG